MYIRGTSGFEFHVGHSPYQFDYVSMYNSFLFFVGSDNSYVLQFECQSKPYIEWTLCDMYLIVVFIQTERHGHFIFVEFDECLDLTANENN